MAWTELRVDVARGAAEEAGAALFAHGCAGLEEVETAPRRPRQPWDTGPEEPLAERLVLKAYFESPDRPAVEAALAAVEGTSAPSWHAVADADWEGAWRAAFEPIVVGALVVAPPWDVPEAGDGIAPIVLEPGQGFGTGQHPSTRACLAAIQEIVAADAQVRTCLDVGAGSGVIALAAARLGLEARGIEVEEPAVAEARANAARNGLAVPFDATPLARVPGRFDLVLANLHAEVLVELAADLVLRTGRWLVLAGVLADREARVRACFEPALELAGRVQEDRWVSLRYRARGS